MKTEQITMYISDDGVRRSERKEAVEKYEYLVGMIDIVQTKFDDTFKDSCWYFKIKVEVGMGGQRLEYFAFDKETDNNPDEELCAEERILIDEIGDRYGIDLVSHCIYYWCK